MRKIILILTLFITGCGTRTDTITSGNVNDPIMNDTPVTTTTDKQAEDFNEFFKKFTTDSLFQFERVKFPWILMTWELGENAPIKKEITKGNWKFSSFYYDDSYATLQIDAYTQQIKHYGDTVKIEIRGIDNGIFTDYEFTKDSNKWFLVRAKDYSN